MVRALAHDPRKLDEIDRLVRDLERTEAGTRTPAGGLVGDLGADRGGTRDAGDDASERSRSTPSPSSTGSRTSSARPSTTSSSGCTDAEPAQAVPRRRRGRTRQDTRRPRRDRQGDRAPAATKRVERIDVVYVCSNADIARQNINRLNVTGKEEFNLADAHHAAAAAACGELKSTRPQLRLVHAGHLVRPEVARRAWPRSARSSTGSSSTHGAGAACGTSGSFDVLRAGARPRELRELRRLDADRFGSTRGRSTRISPTRSRRSCARGRVGRTSRAADASRAVRCDSRDRSRRPRGQDWTRRGSRSSASCGPSSRAAASTRSSRTSSSSTSSSASSDLLDGDERRRRELAQHLVRPARARPRRSCSRRRRTRCTRSPTSATTTTTPTSCGPLRFLMGDETARPVRRASFGDFRRALLRLDGSGRVTRPRRARRESRRRLRRVMVRTERLAVTADRNGMLADARADGLALEPARPPRHTSSCRARQPVPGRRATCSSTGSRHRTCSTSWRPTSSSGSFDARSRCRATARSSRRLLQARATGCCRRGDRGDTHASTRGTPASAALMTDVLDTEAWRLLWMPPSLPVLRARVAPFARSAAAPASPSGSSSRRGAVVPQAIATLLSYEAERRMMRTRATRAREHAGGRGSDPAAAAVRPRGGPPDRHGLLGLLYPSPALARLGDPLALGRSTRRRRRRRRRWTRCWRERARDRVRASLDRIVKGGARTARSTSAGTGRHRSCSTSVEDPEATPALARTSRPRRSAGPAACRRRTTSDSLLGRRTSTEARARRWRIRARSAASPTTLARSSPTVAVAEPGELRAARVRARHAGCRRRARTTPSPRRRRPASRGASARCSTSPRSWRSSAARARTRRRTGARCSSTASTAASRRCSTSTPTCCASALGPPGPGPAAGRRGRWPPRCPTHCRIRAATYAADDIRVDRRRRDARADWRLRARFALRFGDAEPEDEAELQRAGRRAHGLQLAVLAVRARDDVGRPGGARLPPVLPRGRALEPARQPGRPRAARGPRPPLQGPRDPQEPGESSREHAYGRRAGDPWEAMFEAAARRGHGAPPTSCRTGSMRATPTSSATSRVPAEPRGREAARAQAVPRGVPARLRPTSPGGPDAVPPAGRRRRRPQPHAHARSEPAMRLNSTCPPVTPCHPNDVSRA